MEYHEVRVVAELRKQGEHDRAEEFRLKAMRRTRRRIRAASVGTTRRSASRGPWPRPRP